MVISSPPCVMSVGTVCVGAGRSGVTGGEVTSVGVGTVGEVVGVIVGSGSVGLDTVGNC